ncbi:unnamed protein product [Rotaria socialis]
MAYSNSNEKHSATRFADLGALPKRMLAPIEGYEKTPLVTLEEAVKPLVKIVPKVERNVFIVKQNCQEPEDGLTTDESAAIMLYTYESMPHEDSLYVKLNDSLRSEQRKNLIPWFLYLRLILTALARLPSECSAILRGVKEDLSAEYSKGKTFICEKGALHILPTIDVSTVAAITSLFTPWKNVIERVQATNTPSLHIVVTSYWYLFECLVVTKDEAADKAATGLIFFKRRTQQLLRAMFSLHDLHWIAAILNPRTRMLKRATDVERTHANCLVKAEITKIIETHQIDYNSPLLSSGNASSSPPS